MIGGDWEYLPVIDLRTLQLIPCLLTKIHCLLFWHDLLSANSLKPLFWLKKKKILSKARISIFVWKYIHPIRKYIKRCKTQSWSMREWCLKIYILFIYTCFLTLHWQTLPLPLLTQIWLHPPLFLSQRWTRRTKKMRIIAYFLSQYLRILMTMK